MRINRPKITLSPWEVAPNYESTPKSIGSIFNLRMSIEGSNRPVGTAKFAINDEDFCVVFLRFLDEENTANWVFVDYDGTLRKTGKRGDLKLPWRINHDEMGYYPYLGRLFNAQALGVGDDESLFISVGSYGAASWFSTRMVFDNANFRLDARQIGLLFNTPLATVKDVLRKEILAPDSEANFALKWATLSKQERNRLIYRTRTGSWDEFVALLHAVEVLFYTSKENYFFLNELNSGWFFWVFNGIPNTFSRRRYLWNLELVRYFQPFIPDDLYRYLCVHSWADGIGGTLRLDNTPVSAHDQMEASHLLLRWAQDKMSPKKLKLLLPY